MIKSLAAVVLALLLIAGGAAQQSVDDLPLEEVGIAQLQEAMTAGRLTARRLVDAYIDRIAAIDRAGPALNSIIIVNPDARAIADALDAERRAGRVRGPLHGIPVVIKDNIDTADRMPTTAGSLALEHSIASTDAFVVSRLRAAGAVIIGKTNLSEWANFRSTASTSGWSGVGGLTRNPYVLDRNACGSSSGTGAAVSASLAAVGVGTETDGSIVCPSSVSGLVGIKPTVGLISRFGIIPISKSQDTAGPIARTVSDAALLLGVLAGADPRDEATAAGRSHVQADYRSALDANALSGARIGVMRKQYFGYSASTDRLIEQAIADLKSHGAVIVDPADLPTAGDLDACELEVLQYEFKAGLNDYLRRLPASVPVHSLADVIAFNERNRDRELRYFGQERLVASQARGPLTETGYTTALATCRERARDKGLDLLFGGQKLDAVIAPTGSPAWLTDLVNGDHFLGASSTPAAVAGYPTISVPAGQVRGLPVGLTFVGPAWSEARLIGLAYAYEQISHHRQPPRFLLTVAPGLAEAR